MLAAQLPTVAGGAVTLGWMREDRKRSSEAAYTKVPVVEITGARRNKS